MIGERLRRTRGRWLVPAALAVAALAVLVVALPLTGLSDQADDAAAADGDWLPTPQELLPGAGEEEAERRASEAGEPQSSEPDDVAEPTGLRIPAIGVEQQELTDLGLKDDGAMAVPDFGDAGWYERGPKPGEPGGGVIAAHYDSTDGPDVFYDLGELERGDVVEVDAADGRTGVWRVTGSQQTPKDELPGDRIWPGGDQPQLALITCGGVFDESTGHYTHNEIVYAEWEGWRDT